MNHRFSLTIALALVAGLAPSTRADFNVSTFDDLGLPANSHRNDAGPPRQFVSGGNAFLNSFSPSFGGLWSGFAASSETDNTTPGFTNQYSAIAGSGAGGSGAYGVGFTFAGPVSPTHPDGSVVNLAPGSGPVSVQVTNTTYDYFSMLNGDQFSRKFAAGDFFLLTIAGYDSVGGAGAKVGEVDVYLANFLGSDPTKFTILNTWQTVDLGSLAGARSLRFGLESSDNDPAFGMNTPAYFALDNLVTFTAAVPEPSSGLLCLIGIVAVPLARRRSNSPAANARSTGERR